MRYDVKKFKQWKKKLFYYLLLYYFHTRNLLHEFYAIYLILLVNESETMSDIVSRTFSKDVSSNNVACVFKANKPNEFVPTQSAPRSLEGNSECDDDANKRLCNGEDKGLDSSSEINLCSKAIIHSNNERSAKKDITNTKLRIKMFSSSSDETDTDETNVNRRFIVSYKDIIKSHRKENFNDMQIDLPENYAASCESDDAATNVPDQIKKSSNKNGKRVNEKRNKIVQKLRRHKSSKVIITDKLKREDTNLNTSDAFVKNVPNLSNICDNSDSSEDTNTDDSMIKIKRLKNHGSKRVLVNELESSEEEDKQPENYHKREKIKRPQNEDSKISSKPTKMSAKQAMENRQIIKRESNRMLRDKQVTLPYHRPKPLSLKEIMSRRCPTLMPNGKELPLKMNEEQLKYFALQLQQQQKELIELCKSDSEDEKSPVISQELDQGANDNKDMLNRFSDNVENGNDDLVGDSRTTMEANQSESQEKATDSGVDLPLCDFKETETFEVSAEKNNETVETNKSVFVNTAESKCDNVANSIASEFNNETNDNYKSTEAGDKKSDYQNMENIIDSKGSTSADRHQAVACINCEISNHETEVSSSVVQDSESIHLQYDSEENKVVSHDSIVKTIGKCDSSLLSHTEDGQLKNSKTKGETRNIEREYNINNNDDYVNDNSVLFGDISEGIEDFDVDSIVDMANKERCSNSVHEINASTLAQDISLNVKPKLTGVPGMIIDLADFDSSDATVSQKISGLELLKQKFQYFAKIKTPDDLEREKEKKFKPGTLHSKLKQELENKIAEQRSLEWSRRLEEEIQNKLETNNMIEDKANNDEDELESIEAKLKDESDFEDENNSGQESDSEEESEPEDIMCDDVKKKNPLIADEAEESGVDDEYEASGNEDNSDIEKVSQDDNSSDSESESSEEDEINETSKRKGRILKAFEDSDDEGNKIQECKDDISESVLPNCDKNLTEYAVCNIDHKLNGVEQLQVSHLHKNQSEDLFASQNTDIENNLPIASILNDQNEFYSLNDKNVSHSLQKVDKCLSPSHGQSLEKLPMICANDTDNEVNLDDVALMCSGTFSQNLVTSQSMTQMTQFSETQKITENDISINEKDTYGSEIVKLPLLPSKVVGALKDNDSHESSVKKSSVEENLLCTIMDEMDEADLDNPKQNKYFCGHSSSTDKKSEKNSITVESKKKLIIESDEEETDVEIKKRLKRKKREKRVLQISDDEEELSGNDSGSETNEDFILDGSPKNVVEYDSEENEVEVLLPRKIKRKARDFLEQEAELTSEDEWVGSGDEDEVGLDLMEREEGDDETFNQMKLRDELGQIHMRDVLDQDKREVRLLQELLLEDGDLGEGHRQRKFRWKNADGEEMTGTVPNEMTDTQEEEFESEELWRKQRHERETFLRQMKEQDKEIFNSSITRNTIIKANLNSKSISSLLLELNTTNTMEPESVTKEKKNALPSPFKEQCPIFQQQSRNSLLSRGKNTLDRLAALATPLAADAEQEPTNMSALAPSRKRNFVFSILTPPTNENKVTKRKATSHAGTPNLMKKMKVNESQKPFKKSLLDQMNL